ncbi:exported hypothetical protein [Candidatus Terasakiella magnetica]|uniref:Uncharacterized protein n=1 Tax=Candidatus Terasakiella magnetica TaxID=1867952 RepID=A0A1C3RI38_9PROT|nr:exported hypothetical protein [Candidatus Terasakiella magnetica]
MSTTLRVAVMAALFFAYSRGDTSCSLLIFASFDSTNMSNIFQFEG